MPSLDAIKADILSLGPDIHVDTTTPDLFFFIGDERRMPFATIVTHDTDFDGYAQLDRDGAFRLNISLDRHTFATLFPEHNSRAALEAANFDYATRDSILPHPVYGRMHWVCSINPDSSYPQCQTLLRTAYELGRR